MNNESFSNRGLMPPSIMKRVTLGFAAFDIWHILTSLALLIYAYVTRPIDALLAAECGVEIVFALLLILFITTLVRHNDHGISFPMAYGFAWLVAVASLFVPLSFSIPEIIVSDWPEEEVVGLVLTIVSIVLSFLCFVLVFLALPTNHRIIRWRRLITAAVVLIIVLVPVLIVHEFFVERSMFERVVSAIADVAPLIPAISALSFLWRKDSKELLQRSCGMIAEKK